MSLLKDISKNCAEFGRKIKDATVELATGLLDIVKKNVTSDLTEESEENTTKKMGDTVETVVDAVATVIAVVVVAAVANLFRKIK